MGMDSKGTAYSITLSGLSVIPFSSPGTATRPQITPGARGIVNSADGTPNFKPGSFVTVNGTNLASASTADSIPDPTVLGGSCIVFNDVPLPLLETSSGQILAQVPATTRPGQNVMQVRSVEDAPQILDSTTPAARVFIHFGGPQAHGYSLATAQSSDPLVITVQKP